MRNGNTFLYATGPVTSLNDPDLNVTQTWTLWERRGKDGAGHMRKVGSGTTAPNFVGKGVFGSSDSYNGRRELRRPHAGQRHEGVRRPA